MIGGSKLWPDGMLVLDVKDEHELEGFRILTRTGSSPKASVVALSRGAPVLAPLVESAASVTLAGAWTARATTGTSVCGSIVPGAALRVVPATLASLIGAALSFGAVALMLMSRSTFAASTGAQRLISMLLLTVVVTIAYLGNEKSFLGVLKRMIVDCGKLRNVSCCKFECGKVIMGDFMVVLAGRYYGPLA